MLLLANLLICSCSHFRTCDLLKGLSFFFIFIDISVSNGALFESNSFLLTSRVNMGKQIHQVTVKDL